MLKDLIGGGASVLTAVGAIAWLMTKGFLFHQPI